MTALAPSLRPSTLRIPDSVAEYLRANPSYLSPSQISGYSDFATAYFIERVWRKDWCPLRTYLPGRVENVLDIGGGVGGIDLFVHHFRGQPSITLVEQAERHLQGTDFCVLNVARDFLTANGVPRSAISLMTADEKSLSLIEGGNYDVIVSLRALAFVFPFESYRPALLKCLRVGGVMILDIKKKGSDFQRSFDGAVCRRFAKSDPHHDEIVLQLEHDFGFVSVIADHENSIRVLVRRQARAAAFARDVGRAA